MIFEPSAEGGFTARVPALPGCISEGESTDEALANVRGAIERHLEPIDDDLIADPNAEILELVV